MRYVEHKKLKRPSRREILKLLGTNAAVALATSGCGVGPKSKSSGERVDVVVVGAGFAGMTAARRLQQAGKEVVILEARERVGGRVKGGTLAGHPVDVGGMWVGPTQTKLLELLKEHGLHTTPQFEQGKAISEINGKRTYPEGEGTGLDPVAQREYERLVTEMNRLSEQVPLDEPWNAPAAKQLDELTVEQWFRTKTKNADTLEFLRLSIRTVFTTDPFQMSLLYFLFFLHSGDNFETLGGFQNAAQAYLVKETMYQLAVKLRNELSNNIVLEAPVRQISQGESEVTVKSDKGEWHASRVVVAVPLPLSVRIAYDPPLHPHRDILAQHMPMGSVIKCYAAYTKPFWRDRALNGITWNDSPPTAGFFDVSPPEGSPAILAAFIEGQHAVQWTGKPVEERKKAVIDRIVSLFGPQGANPIDYEDQDWPSDPWSRGCYGASMGPGVMTTVAKVIREPHGRIHWAGTETSTKWMGYIEGAIRSGERAAAEVLTTYREGSTRRPM